MLEVLLVDDEPLIRLTVGDALKEVGHQVTIVADGEQAVAALEKTIYDVVITDIRLPKFDGLSLFRQIRDSSPRTDVILITAYGAVSDAVAALKDGARDYLTKPFDTEEILLRVQRLAEERSMRTELEHARVELAVCGRGREIIGRSPYMMRLFDRIEAFSDSDAPVLIIGESGTGKELVARSLHDRSARRNKPFVAVNCAAFPETLLDAELFGHERGAFTGATRRREGRFQAADGGTLFLDEAAEIPPAAQAKLLRVLQEMVVEPLGANRSIKVDVRILSATHRNLRERIADGRFREDLFYRLNVLEIHVPPLRDRHGDLPLLVEYFLDALSESGAKTRITPQALRALSSYSFPGNVRELEHALHQAYVLARNGPIDVEHLPVEVSRGFGSDSADYYATTEAELLPLSSAVKAFEREHLIRALLRVGGKRSKAAELLGISRKTLWEKVRSHGIANDEIS